MPNKKIPALIKRIQANEDRDRARRVARIKRAVTSADFLDHELTAIEAVVFSAYGRTQLR
jgi:hypothetical protein